MDSPKTLQIILSFLLKYLVGIDLYHLSDSIWARMYRVPDPCKIMNKSIFAESCFSLNLYGV